MNAMPVSAAAWLTNSLRVVIVSSSPAGSLAFLMNDAPVRGRGCFGAAHTSSIVREEANDPRPSLQERYPTRADYVAKVTAAAASLVARRLLLPEDAAFLIDQANAAAVP